MRGAQNIDTSNTSLANMVSTAIPNSYHLVMVGVSRGAVLIMHLPLKEQPITLSHPN
jgi:hypothetical protein